MRQLRSSYLPSGGLVIILRVKKLLSKATSLRIILILVLVLFAMLPVIVVCGVIRSAAVSVQMNNLVMDVQNHSLIMSNQLSKGEYFANTDNAVLNSQLVQMANFYNGRAEVIDNTYVIVGDTYVIDKGRYNISELVMKCMSDGTKSFYKRSGWNINIVQPIVSQAEDALSGVLLFSVDAADVEAWNKRVTVIIDIIEIITFIIIAVLSYFVSALLMKPLRKLVGKFKESAKYNVQEDIVVSTYKETRDISDSYNKVLAKLKNLDESRQQFVSNVSHELKTPITSIKILADSLNSQEDVPVELYREFMVDIANEVDRENRIIEDLLSLVRMDKTSNSLNITETKINDLLEALLKQLTPIAAKKNVELILESFRPVVAEVDEMKLTLALSNLVENAIKYNREGGWVKVTLNADHKYFFVKVEDNGIGIPDNEQDKVFDRFYRVDKARSRESGGTGLGLAITQSIVFSHKGDIKLYSKLDEGTTFNVRIPLIYIE
ncbi:MAG: two-component sensor histidine kinase [Lachnospiraceae bacterium]|nr:two-component sensor histidine kinase [Lachnospiraceae bacterium]